MRFLAALPVVRHSRFAARLWPADRKSPFIRSSVHQALSGYARSGSTHADGSRADCAWRAPSWKIVGGPAWLDYEKYDVAATLPVGSSQDQAPLMLQTLLAERFHLVIRPETRQLAVSELTVANRQPRDRQDPNAGNFRHQPQIDA